MVFAKNSLNAYLLILLWLKRVYEQSMLPPLSPLEIQKIILKCHAAQKLTDVEKELADLKRKYSLLDATRGRGGASKGRRAP